jgi:hypothetical protein
VELENDMGRLRIKRIIEWCANIVNIHAIAIISVLFVSV